MHSSIPRRAWLGSAVALLVGGALSARGQTAREVRVIEVVARKFEFVPAEIHVGVGETVELRLTAPEVPMGFNLADFQRRVDVVPGAPATLRLRPDRAGRFTFVCDVFCGTGHEDMSGTLVVG